jgi:hypothetical protein
MAPAKSALQGTIPIFPIPCRIIERIKTEYSLQTLKTGFISTLFSPDRSDSGTEHTTVFE